MRHIAKAAIVAAILIGGTAAPATAVEPTTAASAGVHINEQFGPYSDIKECDTARQKVIDSHKYKVVGKCGLGKDSNYYFVAS
ncbi:MAG: hypothetical protein ACRD0P_20670 [Stackebrandtia sp.]